MSGSAEHPPNPLAHAFSATPQKNTPKHFAVALAAGVVGGFALGRHLRKKRNQAGQENRLLEVKAKSLLFKDPTLELTKKTVLEQPYTWNRCHLGIEMNGEVYVNIKHRLLQTPAKVFLSRVRMVKAIKDLDPNLLSHILSFDSGCTNRDEINRRGENTFWANVLWMLKRSRISRIEEEAQQEITFRYVNARGDLVYSMTAERQKGDDGRLDISKKKGRFNTFVEVLVKTSTVEDWPTIQCTISTEYSNENLAFKIGFTPYIDLNLFFTPPP